MFRCFCFFICSILFAQKLSCKTNDTTNNYRLKGVDVAFGGGGYNYGNKTAVNFLKAMTPQEHRGNYIYDNTYTNFPSASPAKFTLNIVFGDNNKNKNFIFHKHEYFFRFAFESERTYGYYDSLRYSNIKNNASSVIADYTYQTQALGLGYQFSSKSFLKNFALFGGVNSDFGMLILKKINYLSHIPTANKLNNFYSTFARANCNLGIKYNFSCDINFFFQTEAGLIRYGKEINTNGRYMGASFGIRYKFLEEQDKLNYKNNSFW